MNPSGFAVLFLQGTIDGSQFRDFFADNAGVVTSEAVQRPPFHKIPEMYNFMRFFHLPQKGKVEQII